MKKILSTNRKGLVSVDEENHIISLHDYKSKEHFYFDYEGNPIPEPVISTSDFEEEEDETDDPTQFGSLINGFYSYTTHEIVEEPGEDEFGLFGIKDRQGNVIVEEKYWQIGWFSNGLCPVREVEGNWGCVNQKGELVLPCIYWDQPIFNKYGVAYGNNSLIDMQGNEIEGTEYNCINLVGEDDRYLSIILMTEEQEEESDTTGYTEGVKESFFDTKLHEYVVRDLPECGLDLKWFDGEPCVVCAAAEMIDDYERIRVSGKGIIEGIKENQIDIYDYYD